MRVPSVFLPEQIEGKPQKYSLFQTHTRKHPNTCPGAEDHRQSTCPGYLGFPSGHTQMRGNTRVG